MQSQFKLAATTTSVVRVAVRRDGITGDTDRYRRPEVPGGAGSGSLEL
jgi:hypothetical protein